MSQSKSKDRLAAEYFMWKCQISVPDSLKWLIFSLCVIGVEAPSVGSDKISHLKLSHRAVGQEPLAAAFISIYQELPFIWESADQTWRSSHFTSVKSSNWKREEIRRGTIAGGWISQSAYSCWRQFKWGPVTGWDACQPRGHIDENGGCSFRALTCAQGDYWLISITVMARWFQVWMWL